jgi:hypothetical protein
MSAYQHGPSENVSSYASLNGSDAASRMIMKRHEAQTAVHPQHRDADRALRQEMIQGSRNALCAGHYTPTGPSYGQNIPAPPITQQMHAQTNQQPQYGTATAAPSPSDAFRQVAMEQQHARQSKPLSEMMEVDRTTRNHFPQGPRQYNGGIQNMPGMYQQTRMAMTAYGTPKTPASASHTSNSLTGNVPNTAPRHSYGTYTSTTLQAYQ